MVKRIQSFGKRFPHSPTVPAILRQGYGIALLMFYTYILYSPKIKDFYYGTTSDLKKRFQEHNSGLSKSTKAFFPWRLVWYGAFEKESLAKAFERYLKTGSGKAFSYKRLLDTVVLKKDKMG